MSRRDHGRERGQGLVEFTLLVPMIVLLVISVAELGLAFGNTHTLGYGSREGARVGSALAAGNVTDCTTGPDPAGVDKSILGAVHRILQSPGSGIDAAKVLDVTIFKADANGDQVSGTQSTWTYAPGATEVEPGVYIDFAPPAYVPWPACVRDNSGATPDSIGVTVRYQHDFVSPLPSMVEALTGGDLSFTLTETTVMSLNPSI